MKITKEGKRTILDYEKDNFVYVEHPRHWDRFLEIGADYITIKNLGLLCGSKRGYNKIQPDMKIEYYESKFMRRMVILYKFIKWLFKA